MGRYRGGGLLMAAAAGLALASGAAAQEAHPSLGFLKFTVADLPAMQAFYMTAFGLSVQKDLDNPDNRELILTNPKGLDLALVQYKDRRKVVLGNANGPIGFYLSAADVDAFYKRAVAAGAVSRSTPGGGGGLRVAIVADPEGHDIELLHLP
jgi:lactoylglutathione lyase